MKTLSEIIKSAPRNYWTTVAWRTTVAHLEIGDLLRLAVIYNAEEDRAFLAAVVASTQQHAVALAGQNYPPGFTWYDKGWPANGTGQRQARAYATACISNRVNQREWTMVSSWSSTVEDTDNYTLLETASAADRHGLYPKWLQASVRDIADPKNWQSAAKQRFGILRKAKASDDQEEEKEERHVWKRPGRFKRTKNTK